MIARWGALIFVVAVIVGSCFPMLRGHRIAFRDVSHFYLPLYDYVADRTATEWLPWWNPLDHCGMPLIGETSTAVFYPIRYVVFSLPISSEWAMNAYLLIHLLIASMTASWLARRCGYGIFGKSAVAIIYPLSGSVFSLCCNPPFLVGAAWLPLALGACLVRPAGGSQPNSVRRRVFLAATAFSMMVLGGDPQSALHCALVVVAVTLARWGKRRFVSGEDDSDASEASGGALVTCVLGGCLALAICSPQVVASFDWSRQSDRMLSNDARHDLYDFSLAPWHVAEVVTPRPFGHPFPTNRRVSRLLTAEGRMWTPSIYAGFVVAIALICRLLQPREYFCDPWFAIAVVSLMLCFGHYGVVWLLQQIPGTLVGRESAIGGPYWFLVTFLPGYDSFRYPVKWLPLFALASAMVAGKWLSTPRGGYERGVLFGLVTILLVSGASAHWNSVVWDAWYESNRITLPVDEYWGPLDVAGGFAMVRISCLWSLLAIIAVLYLRSRRDNAADSKTLRWGPVCWLVLIACDGMTNSLTLLPTVDIDRERLISHQVSPPPIERLRTLRTQAGSWPERWRASRSENRVLEVAASERVAWFGRWHLTQRTGVLNSMVSIESRRYGDFWDACYEQLPGMDLQQRRLFWAGVRQWIAIGAVSHVDEGRALAADGLSVVEVLRKETEPVASVRVRTRWKDEASLDEIVREIADEGTVPLPHVDVDPPTESMSVSAQMENLDDGLIRVVCDSTCVLERCVLQDGNWIAKLVSADGMQQVVPVLRSSHLNQAVAVPEGDWTVKFVYQPWWKWPSLIAMFAGVLVWVYCLFAFREIGWRSARGIVFFGNTGTLTATKV